MKTFHKNNFSAIIPPLLLLALLASLHNGRITAFPTVKYSQRIQPQLYLGHQQNMRVESILRSSSNSDEERNAMQLTPEEIREELEKIEELEKALTVRKRELMLEAKQKEALPECKVAALGGGIAGLAPGVFLAYVLLRTPYTLNYEVETMTAVPLIVSLLTSMIAYGLSIPTNPEESKADATKVVRTAFTGLVPNILKGLVLSDEEMNAISRKKAAPTDFQLSSSNTSNSPIESKKQQSLNETPKTKDNEETILKTGVKESNTKSTFPSVTSVEAISSSETSPTQDKEVVAMNTALEEIVTMRRKIRQTAEVRQDMKNRISKLEERGAALYNRI